MKVISPTNFHTGGAPPRSATQGVDAEPVPGHCYLAEIMVVATVLASGIAIVNGSRTAGEVTVSLVDLGGNLVARSQATPQSGPRAYQRLSFPEPVLVWGPATYYVVAQFSDADARFLAIEVGSFGAGRVASTYGVLPAPLVVPTDFAGGCGPVASLF